MVLKILKESRARSLSQRDEVRHDPDAINIAVRRCAMQHDTYGDKGQVLALCAHIIQDGGWKMGKNG